MLPFRISICGLNQLAEHTDVSVTNLVSILDPDAPCPDVVSAFGRDRRLELRFHDVLDPSPGRVAFGSDHLEVLLEYGRSVPAKWDTHLLVHCSHGMSRSPAVMALMLAQAMPGVSGATIFSEILRIRPITWPNIRIVEFGDARLGRAGDLLSAAKSVYRSQLASRPEWAEELRRVGRGREVAAAADGDPLIGLHPAS